MKFNGRCFGDASAKWIDWQAPDRRDGQRSECRQPQSTHVPRTERAAARQFRAVAANERADDQGAKQGQPPRRDRSGGAGDLTQCPLGPPRDKGCRAELLGATRRSAPSGSKAVTRLLPRTRRDGHHGIELPPANARASAARPDWRPGASWFCATLPRCRSQPDTRSVSSPASPGA